MLDLEPIKARLAPIGNRRWEARRWDNGHSAGVDICPEGAQRDVISGRGGRGWGIIATVAVDRPGSTYYGRSSEYAADLIAHAPVDLAALVAEVERLRANQFDEYAVCCRLAAITEAATWQAT